MKSKIIYEDDNILVTDKPAGIDVLSLIKLLSKKHPNLKNVGKAPRYGIVHRLDKDTSGILLVAKNNKSLIFFQNQFKQRRVEKRYTALIIGILKYNRGEIRTLIGRNPKNRKKQKVFLKGEPGSKEKREAISEYKVIERFSAQGGPAKGGKDYTLVEVKTKTGRKHQIRCHFSYLGYPLAGDKKYKLKNQPCPEGLNRQFLHASYMKIKLPDGKDKEFISELPEDLKKVMEKLKV